MRDDHYRLVEYVFWAGQAWFERSRKYVERRLGGSKILMATFELRAFPVKSCRIRPGVGPTSSSPFSSFLGPVAAWGCLLLI